MPADPMPEAKKEGKMKVTRMSEVPKERNVTRLFTGPDVTRQALLPESKDLRIGIINFGKGIRNKFHSHDGDQVLIVSAGRGTVATETTKKAVTVGDVILIPAGEKHWHGASEDSEFSHIVISKAGVRMTQLED